MFVIIFFLSPLTLVFANPITEPYLDLHDFNSESIPVIPESPDPLVQYSWESGSDQTQLQIYYTSQAENITIKPSTSFRNVNSDLTQIAVLGPGEIEIDFGVERAAWLEIYGNKWHSNGCDSMFTLEASISEYNEPWTDKRRVLTAYDDGWYRLETNDDLYEGVRYAWLYVSQHTNSSSSFKLNSGECTLDLIRLASQVKPVAYLGRFSSSRPDLDSIFYTGAYGVRLNMLSNEFNSILMERGDRVSIQGDGHPTMAAALVTFASEVNYPLSLSFFLSFFLFLWLIHSYSHIRFAFIEACAYIWLVEVTLWVMSGTWFL